MRAMTVELSPDTQRRLREHVERTGEPPEAFARELIEKALPMKMTYEEFLQWADEDTLAEWVNGEVVMTSPASRKHQMIAGFLGKVMGLYVEYHDMGVVLSAPFQMKLEHGREPDLLFVAREHLERLLDNRLEGPADVVVEIVSPESAVRDRGEKFYEYEANGVSEYWLIDPEREWAECYRLDEQGRYRTVFAASEGIYRSDVIPGFWLRVDWLWQEPLPLVDEVVLDIGGEEYARRLLELVRQRGWGTDSEEQGRNGVG